MGFKSEHALAYIWWLIFQYLSFKYNLLYDILEMEMLILSVTAYTDFSI